mmetsp:Transcript_2644/g.9219  ORF Transcript_2644/g.9219 Transcript_2644/m.9219 type:complete len:222 (-) Transcript_2644:4045-4710(-)
MLSPLLTALPPSRALPFCRVTAAAVPCSRPPDDCVPPVPWDGGFPSLPCPPLPPTAPPPQPPWATQSWSAVSMPPPPPPPPAMMSALGCETDALKTPLRPPPEPPLYWLAPALHMPPRPPKPNVSPGVSASPYAPPSPATTLSTLPAVTEILPRVKPPAPPSDHASVPPKPPPPPAPHALAHTCVTPAGTVTSAAAGDDGAPGMSSKLNSRRVASTATTWE